MKKCIAFILTGLIIALSLYGCDNNVKTDKNNKLALEVTKNFIQELEENNFDGVKKCYNPKLKENTPMLEKLEETGRTNITIYDNASLELQKVKKCSMHDTIGKITNKYTLNIENTVKLDCTFEFDLIKVGKKWYLDSDPKINSSVNNKNTALTNAETIRLAIKYCQSNITHRNNEVYNNNRTYIDLDGVMQIVPDAVEERAKITTYDVFGVNDILDCVKPVIYDGEIFEPYWDTHTDNCIFMSLDYIIMSSEDNHIQHIVHDTITPLTENGKPSKQVLVYGL